MSLRIERKIKPLQQKVNYIKIQNEELKIVLASREALYITLAHKDQAQTDAKEIFILFLKED